MTKDLYIRSLSVCWSDPLKTSYVGRIPALRGLTSLSFSSPVTFFAGENGSGKSTLLEAIAIAAGLNPEGGTVNYRFSTYDDHSSLFSAIRLVRGAKRPSFSYFLRAETFFNAASAVMERYNDDGRLPDLHARSHGESFLDFVEYRWEPGLYLMDEPEAALSPSRQLTLLRDIVLLSREGAQFIIATHSPILLGTPDASILSFDGGSIRPIEYEETESFRTLKLFTENRESLLRELLK